MAGDKSDFSEKKEILLAQFYVWFDVVSDDFNGYCEKTQILVLQQVFQSLRDSVQKHNKGKRIIKCGRPNSSQLKNLGARQWISQIEIQANSDQPRNMFFEKDILHIRTNEEDLIKMLSDLDDYCHRRVHAFSLFSVPQKVSNRRSTTQDFYLWYNLEGTD